MMQTSKIERNRLCLTPNITIAFVGALFAGIGLTGQLSAQEEPSDIDEQRQIIMANGDAARVKVGPEHVTGEERRYASRISSGSLGVVTFSTSPAAETSFERGPAPSLSDLIGNPSLQAALDRAAKPGHFVTPPAAVR